MTARIGILGGTFDPIHFGHLAIAEEVRVALSLDRVLFVPAAQQPLKPWAPGAPAAHRIAMARLACATNPNFAVSDIEVVRAGPSYTVLTLEALRVANIGDLYFILGADALADLPRWHEPARVLQLAHLVAVQRPRTVLDMEALLQAVPALQQRLSVIHGPQLDISSTELRQRAARQQPLRYLVPDAVADYIAANELYRHVPDAIAGE